MDSKELALSCSELADDRKAEDIVILDMRKVSSIADYFVIVSGSSDPHLRAIGIEIEKGIREKHKLRPHLMEGTTQTGWIVLDYFDAIVHIMRTDVRERYDLEGLWGDAPRIQAASAMHASAESSR